jgi:DnaK suppressor protein
MTDIDRCQGFARVRYKVPHQSAQTRDGHCGLMDSDAALAPCAHHKGGPVGNTATFAGKPQSKKLHAGEKYADIRYDLERQRAALIRSTANGFNGGPEPEVIPDLNEQASTEADQHLLLMMKEREQRRLKEIDAALARLDDNTYGICDECEEEIPYKRLKVRPMTTLCVPCKSRQEEIEKLRHAPWRSE